MDSQPGSRPGWHRAALVVAGLFALFWLALLPLPGPLGRARARWMQQSNGAAGGNSQSAVDGTIALEDSHGTLTLTPTVCISGHLRSFYGVALTDPHYAETSARVVLPESGSPHVTLSKPGLDDVIFNANTCSTWDVDIHPDNVDYNIVEDLQGHARFDCRANGVHLTGNLNLYSCH